MHKNDAPRAAPILPAIFLKNGRLKVSSEKMDEILKKIGCLKSVT